MSDSGTGQFDPYYKWLAIPPDQRPSDRQPPDHYRLLGIRTFEGDREVIAIAADRQMAHVKTFAVGKYSRESQKLLDELAKAKLCLLNPVKKAAYDDALQNEIEGIEIVTISDIELPPLPPSLTRTAAPEAVAPVFIGEIGSRPRSTSYRRRPRRTPFFLWCGVAFLLSIAGILLIRIKARYAEHVRQEQVGQIVEPSSTLAPDYRRRDSASYKPEKSQQLPKPTPLQLNKRQKLQPSQPLTHQDFQKLQPKLQPFSSNPPAYVDSPKQKLKLIGLPRFVALPTTSDETPMAFCPLPPETQISLVSIENELALSGDGNVEWANTEGKTSKPFAHLQADDGELRFQWFDNVPQEAEESLRNSVLLLQLNEEKHTLALRETITSGDEISFDLIDNKFAIKSPAEFPPPTEAIHFQLLGRDAFPPHEVEGADPASMAIGDECVLRFYGAQNLWTTISLNRTGKVAIAYFTSMYELPSGRRIPMSIKKGNAEGRKIDRELQSIANARQALPRLQSARSEALSNLSTARNRNNQLAVGELQALLNTIDAQIAEGNRLIAEEPAVRADYKEQMAVTKLAQQLEKIHNLPYRFYILVDGYEVDLIRVGDTSP